MDRINLLKPDIVTGYLDNGRGQEVTYLQVNPHMSIQNLKEDIAHGAIHLKEVEELAAKKPSRFVVIKCKNKEAGLLAVSYLSSIYNLTEGKDWDEGSDSHADDISKEQDLSFADYSTLEEDEDLTDELDPDLGTADGDWQDTSTWCENPWRIPVVNMNELCQDDQDAMAMFFGGGKSYGGLEMGKNTPPYWKYTRKENFCIVFDPCPSIFDSRGSFFNENVFKRYESNRHVFLIVVDKFALEREKYANDEESEYDGESWYDSPMARVILNYSADIISMHHEEEDMKHYYENLFENWVRLLGYSLEDHFPVSSISQRIVDMADDSKSSLFERVVRYATKDLEGNRPLTEDDFKILYKLRGLGFSAKEEDKKHKGLKKLENSLVGMEDIKDQIRNIVDVFKYNKLRTKMGLKTGGYHNVHMMLGAPGTAKTTVAQILGSIMAEEKLLKGDSFISINGAEMKGKYVGHSAPKVKQLFDENDVIFVDEAYSIAAGSDGESDSFGQEAIAQLIIELEKHGMDRLIIFAGYGGPNVSAKDNRMRDFLNSNPGIRSRINSTIFFDSYNADQMTKIFRGLAASNSFDVPRAADKYVREYFAERVHEDDFGNGREARSLLENASAQAAGRLVRLPENEITPELLRKISVNDVKRAIEKMRRSAAVQKGAGQTRLGF